MKHHLITVLSFGLLVRSALAQNQHELTNSQQKISYALGMNIAIQLKRDEVDIDTKALAAGMADTLAGKPALTPEQQKITMREMQKDIQAKAEAKKKIAAAKNLKEGEAFLAANAKKSGVQVIKTTTSEGLPAEVQYQVLKAGTGPASQPNDILKLDYEGRLLDGNVFDSSLQRGVPFTGRANDFVPGWTEPVKMMKVGDKWRLFIPPSLGYGEFMPYDIGPNSTLIYDIELLAIEKPAGANPAAAVPAK